MISCKVLAVTDDPEARKGIVGDADYNMLWYCRADPRFQYCCLLYTSRCV